jgi:uncharacterized membrane protein (DUF485 family)
VKVDYNALAASYSAMSDEDFDVIKREDLTDEARACYDHEKSRRVPGWHYEPPDANAQFAEFLDQHQKMKRRFKINRILLILLYVVFFMLLTQTPNEYITLRIYLQFAGMVLFLASLFRLQNSARRSGYAVLWLRRFHRRQQKPFQRALERACMFVGMPLTVQDSSFRFSMNYALGLFEKYLWFILLALVVGGFIATRVEADVFVMAICGLMVVIIGTAYWWGFIRIRKSGPLNHLKGLLSDIRTGKIRNFGTLILRCGDSFWRGAVDMATHYADAIVIDVTEPSDNVIWELQTAADARPPENILLACAAKDTTQPELRQALKARLQPLAGDIPLDRCPVFFYPERAGYFDRHKISWRDLQEPLIACLRYAPVHDDADLV